MFVNDALERTSKLKSRDQLTQDMLSRCGQVASELRVIGDALETRFHRTLRLEAARRQNHWRSHLVNKFMATIKECLLEL